MNLQTSFVPRGRRQFLLGLCCAMLGASKGRHSAAQPADAAAPYNGEAFLITYPDYPITVEGSVDNYYGYVDFVGHAGVLLISAKGLTKYYEFGRYNGNDNGEVQNRSVTNVVIDANGKSTSDSLKTVFGELSKAAGKGGRMRAAYFLNMNFQAMQKAAVAKQRPYAVDSYNCSHYARSVIHAGNADIDHPCVADPTPNNLISEYIEEKNAEVNFNPEDDSFSVGVGDETDAKGQTFALCY